MTDQQPKTTDNGTKDEKSAISLVLQGAKEALQGMREIFQNYQEGPKGTVLGDQVQKMKDAEDGVYRATIVLEAISAPTGDAAKVRPSEKSSENIRKMTQPQDDTAKERLVRWQNSELKEDELRFFKDQCNSAKFLLTAIKGAIGRKPSAVDCESILKTLMQAQADLAGPRRMLVGLKGYEVPTFAQKKVSKEDATKQINNFDTDIDKAIENIDTAIEYCKSDGANPDFKPYADALDQALDAIADADASLKCYEGNVDKK